MYLKNIYSVVSTAICISILDLSTHSVPAVHVSDHLLYFTSKSITCYTKIYCNIHHTVYFHQVSLTPLENAIVKSSFDNHHLSLPHSLPSIHFLKIWKFGYFIHLVMKSVNPNYEVIVSFSPASWYQHNLLNIYLKKNYI